MKHQIPNAISCLRIALIWPFLTSLLNQNYEMAFIVFAIAGLSDGLDGYVARRFDWTSRLGRFFDAIADKLLLLTSFIALVYLNKLPLWVISILISRDIYIMIGACVYYCLFNKLDLKPSFIGKVSISLQIILIFLLLFEVVFSALPQLLIQLVIVVIIISALISLLDYLYAWSRKTYVDWGEAKSPTQRVFGIICLLLTVLVLTAILTWSVLHFFN